MKKCVQIQFQNIIVINCKKLKHFSIEAKQGVSFQVYSFNLRLAIDARENNSIYIYSALFVMAFVSPCFDSIIQGIVADTADDVKFSISKLNYICNRNQNDKNRECNRTFIPFCFPSMASTTSNFDFAWNSSFLQFKTWAGFFSVLQILFS